MLRKRFFLNNLANTHLNVKSFVDTQKRAKKSLHTKKSHCIAWLDTSPVAEVLVMPPVPLSSEPTGHLYSGQRSH